MNRQLTALIIEDDISIRTSLKNFLLINNYVVFEAYSLESAQLIIEKEKIDIILLDLRLGDEDGFLIFEQSKILGKSPEIIIMTGFSEQENILRALKLGARDFLQKPVNLDDLKKALERTFAFEQMRRRIKSLSKSVTFFQDELNKNYNLRIIGNSAKIIKVYELAKLAAESPDASVFITGQSGTGKELVARFIHNASSRKKKFFML